jgi:hypothetical protein
MLSVFSPLSSHSPRDTLGVPQRHTRSLLSDIVGVFFQRLRSFNPPTDTLGVPSLRHARHTRCLLSLTHPKIPTCSTSDRSPTLSVSQSHLAQRPTPLSSSLNLSGFIDGLVQLSSYTRFIPLNRRLACRDLQRDIARSIKLRRFTRTLTNVI